MITKDVKIALDKLRGISKQTYDRILPYAGTGDYAAWNMIFGENIEVYLNSQKNKLPIVEELIQRIIGPERSKSKKISSRTLNVVPEENLPSYRIYNR